MKNQWLKNKTLREAKEIKGSCLISDYDLFTKWLKYSDDQVADILQGMRKRTSLQLELMEDAMVIYRLARKKTNEPKS